MVDTLTWMFSAGSFFVTLHLIRAKGFLEGARPVWLIVLLLIPTWFEFVASVKIDPRSACAAAIIVGFLMQPCRDDSGCRWILSDSLVLLLVVSMTISQFKNRSLSPLAPFDHFRDIGLPYIVGRLFLRSERDIGTILPVFCRVAVILSAAACLEAIAHRNPIESIVARPASQVFELEEAVRWGLRRANGPQTHSIYLGLTLALMMPWAAEAFLRSRKGLGPFWWRWVPFLMLAGLIATVSRSAQLAAIAVLGATFFQAFPRRRPAMLFLVALGGISFYTAREDVVLLLSQYAEESRPGDEYVKINGGLREYSGTKHRDLLDLVYQEAEEQSGWFGYGTMMMTMPRDPDMDKRFISIDNHYLMFYLQYGYVGVGLFLAFSVCVLANLLPALLGNLGPTGRLAAGLFGGILGCAIAMRGVWLAPDYARVWFFCAGVSACIARIHRESTTHGALQRA